MDSLIHEYARHVRDADGHVYRARVFGRQRSDKTWIGWLEFSPRGSGGIVRRTRRETTQPSRDALRYWASGLQATYLEGALERALQAASEGRSGRR
ncbi:MAG TPA: hypothetical protein VGS01_05820 [Candidatus Limnocylindria bacterium]|jgi:hypothetical protein|nr:hypothetical protein [Candidatus Limnocylindria bacterium]